MFDLIIIVTIVIEDIFKHGNIMVAQQWLLGDGF